jgi:transcriptional antiterminator RfaH
MMQWFAVHTQPRLELWARTNLWERGFEVYLPQCAKRRRHARRVDTITVPLFPRYLFVHADMSKGDRRRIDTAHGVAYTVAFGDRPAALADAVIAEIRDREGADGLVRLDPTLGLKPGGAVRITEGALADQTGLFDGASDGSRVAVLLTILGRSVRVKIGADRIVAA